MQARTCHQVTVIFVQGASDDALGSIGIDSGRIRDDTRFARPSRNRQMVTKRTHVIECQHTEMGFLRNRLSRANDSYLTHFVRLESWFLSPLAVVFCDGVL